jgi:hypothetical protein
MKRIIGAPPLLAVAAQPYRRENEGGVYPLLLPDATVARRGGEFVDNAPMP